MKGKLIALAALVLLFIPTYIAVGYYISAQDAPIVERVVTSMAMTDLDGSKFTFEKSTASTEESIENNMLAFFMELNSKSVSETTLPAQIPTDSYYLVTFYSYERESNYRYFFTDTPSDAHFVDGDGNAYRIPEEYASRFMLSEYAKSLYNGSATPVMTLYETNIEPTKLTWKYRNYLGEYSISDELDNSMSPVGTYELTGGALKLGFSIQPDLINVTIVENGQTIFDDVYENIGNVNLNEDATINISITAKWYESSERGYAGEASYVFYSDVAAQPIFYLGENSIDPGDFVVMTGVNIKDAASITVTSEPSIDFTPTFFTDGKYVRALIPISIYLPEVVSMCENSTPNEVLNINFTITAAGISQTLTLNVADKAFKTQTYDISADIVNSKRTSATIEAFNKAMADVYTASDSSRLWGDGPFIEATDGLLRTGYGIYRTISATKETYRHEGVDYIVNSTDKAVAVASGKVVYVGEQVLSGKIVVVDHGWGLKSTYCHLSAANVTEGQSVAQGDVLGTVGSSGFTNGLVLHSSLSVYGVTVCPYPLWEDGIIMTMLPDSAVD